jgi:hypothetical protein
MDYHPSCTWIGASGRAYHYRVCPRHPMLVPAEVGNFIYARTDEIGSWVPVLIAQGGPVERAALERMQAERLDSADATHIHFHPNPEPAARRAEEQDLLQRFPGACAGAGETS